MPSSHEEDVALLADFVRRLRRIASHPLVLEDDGNFIRELMRVTVTFQVGPEGKSAASYKLVDEVMFESLAVRIRPLTLTDDRVSFFAALKALDRVTNCPNDMALRITSKALRTEWRECTDKKAMRAYGMHTEDGSYTDVQLAFAWLYQDSVHGDKSTTGHLDVAERFKAAVGVFSQLAVLASEMLQYVTALVAMGLVELPPEAFSDSVIVTEEDWQEKQVEIYASPNPVDFSAWHDMGAVPDGFKPLHEVLSAHLKDESNEPLSS